MPYKRGKSKYWWISYSNGRGGTVRESSNETDWSKADLKEKQMRGAVKKTTEPRYSFDSLMIQYLKAIEHQAGYERAFYALRALRPHFTGMAVDDIGKAHVQSYIQARTEEGRATSTIIKELRVLSAAVTYATKTMGWSINNPVSKNLPAKPDGRLRWITQAEAERLIYQAEQSEKAPYLADIITLALNTGMRRGEILGLTWDRVDLEHRLIYLNPENQKGRKFSSVPLSHEAVAAIKRQEGKHEGFVFVYDGSPIQSVKRSFNNAVRRSGIKDFTFHDLRHTCAAWLVQNGTPIRTVAEILRHSDIRTTMLYAHLSPDVARAAVDNLNFGVKKKCEDDESKTVISSQISKETH